VAAGLVDLAAQLLLETAERAALVRRRVLDEAVDLASFVPFWQVLCDRKTFRITEE
jgi:hypothetical protein